MELYFFSPLIPLWRALYDLHYSSAVLFNAFRFGLNCSVWCMLTDNKKRKWQEVKMVNGKQKGGWDECECEKKDSGTMRQRFIWRLIECDITEFPTVDRSICSLCELMLRMNIVVIIYVFIYHVSRKLYVYSFDTFRLIAHDFCVVIGQCA